LLALLTSVGFGVLSAIFPIVNAEAYVIASQVSAVAGPISIAIGLAIGQTIGKCLLFLAVREGRDSRFIQHRRAEHRDEPVGRFRTWFRAALATLLALVGQKRWGLPIVGLAALIGLPPLYAVALLAGATTMRLSWFAAVVLLGRSVRFVLVALGVGHLDLW
jgi:membrane protein YqaA with SNARE-associated domain